MFSLEITNMIGFVTAMVEFLWCIGPLTAHKTEPFRDPGSPLVTQWNRLYIASNVAFILNGLLTDGILVRLLE